MRKKAKQCADTQKQGDANRTGLHTPLLTILPHKKYLLPQAESLLCYLWYLVPLSIW